MSYKDTDEDAIAICLANPSTIRKHNRRLWRLFMPKFNAHFVKKSTAGTEYESGITLQIDRSEEPRYLNEFVVGTANISDGYATREFLARVLEGDGRWSVILTSATGDELVLHGPRETNPRPNGPHDTLRPAKLALEAIAHCQHQNGAIDEYFLRVIYF